LVGRAAQLAQRTILVFKPVRPVWLAERREADARASAAL
jgi:hypothetical protein